MPNLNTRRGVALTPMEVRRDVIVRTALLADDLGYEVFSVAEGWGLDATVVLAEIAVKTSRIRLLAGILSVWGRSPATIAMAAATLHQLSEGRFILGLGASTRQLVEGWHDTVFADPAGRLRDVATAVRALLAGDRAALRHAPGARALRLGLPAAAEVPIWMAATGERTLPVAADLADGWYPIYLRRDRCRELAATLRQGRTMTIAAGPFTVVDRNVDGARAAVAACTAQYMARMGDVYPALVTAQGLGPEVDLTRAANPLQHRGAGVVPDAAESLLDEFTAYGHPDTVRQQLDRWSDTADITMIGLPPGLPWAQIEATLLAAAPSRIPAALARLGS
jgi:alkanesulfonate monooxygenase SsuD/methylene tetrahydromethanopterin reductase-like flavin-dependent oxidoreductase (luciferase family)